MGSDMLPPKESGEREGHQDPQVPVRILESELIVYRASIKEIARHRLFPRGLKDQNVSEGSPPRRR